MWTNGLIIRTTSWVLAILRLKLKAPEVILELLANQYSVSTRDLSELGSSLGAITRNDCLNQPHCNGSSQSGRLMVLGKPDM